ncbi:MAG: DUF1801 domain-containing protein [Wenzhouxiangella sp.]|jgi:hypothetical protein|nr:DUF1801 domain-containing protein [Wenzhouxiangella sp.]
MSNKTVPTDASVEGYLDAIEDPVRRRDCDTLVEIMRRVTGKDPVMWGSSMVGFDSYHYVYESGREGDSLAAGFSSRAREISVYLMASFDGDEVLFDQLGRHRRGKSCLYIRRLEDIDLAILEQLIAGSYRAIKQRYPD